MPLRHAEALKKVAALHGANHWSNLFSKRSPSAPFSSFFSLGDTSSFPPYTLDIDKVLYAPTPEGELYFGGRIGKGWTPQLNDYGLSHTLIIGEDGRRTNCLIEFLICQQMARGGGVLYLNLANEKSTVANIEQLAFHAGIPFKSNSASDILDEQDLISNAFDYEEAYCLNFNFLTNPVISQSRLDAVFQNIKEELVVRGANRWLRAQYLVVVPNAARIPPENLALLLKKAQDSNIVFIFAESSLDTLGRFNPEIYDTMLEYTEHKVFLQHLSSKAAQSSADLLTPYKFADRLGFTSKAIKKTLVSMWLREALVLSSSTVYRVSTPFLNIPYRPVYTSTAI